MQSERNGGGPSPPLVSVIVPTFNRRRLLVDALETAMAQDYRPIEIIVADDGSTDGTAEMLRDWPDVACLSQANEGVSAARNRAAAHSNGAILAFLDSDNLWPKSRIRIAVEHFRGHPKIGYLLGRQVLVVEPGYSPPPWIEPATIGVPQDLAGAGSLMVRRETWERVGPFNTAFKSGEDTEWLQRAADLGIPMSRLSEVFVHSRLHGDNLSILRIRERKGNQARILLESIRRRRGVSR